VIATLEDQEGRRGVLYNGAHSGEASSTLMSAVSSEARIAGISGELAGSRVGPFIQAGAADNVCILTEAQREQQRNLSVLYSDLFVLKLFRRLEPGPNPDLDLVRFLFERAGFTHVAPPVGYLEYRGASEEPVIAGVMHAYVHNRHDSWRYTIDELGRFFDRALVRKGSPPPVPDHPLEMLTADPPLEVSDLVQSYLEFAHDIGLRTAELHLALASDVEDQAFSPEPFDAFYLRSVHHRMSSEAALTFRVLRESLSRLSPETQKETRSLLQSGNAIREIFQGILQVRSPGLRTRVHGDFHLGQVLYTGDDVIFIDFEGDNSRPLRERLVKRSPLEDVAGMLRSFHYAATSAAFSKVPGLVAHDRRFERVAAWVKFWYISIAGVFLEAYLREISREPILPANSDELRLMLDLFLLEKAIYELGYELQHRPDWVPVALQGVFHGISILGE
jgi:maltose alpha-D-glucosyltransferase/alpha-amylase